MTGQIEMVFNCQKALTTYAKLEKIAKSEIERAESQKRQEAIKRH